MRQLLLDANPLVDQVNKKYQLKIVFHAGLPSPDLQKGPNGSIWALLDGFDPETGRPGRPTAVMTRSQFLGAKVLSNGKRIFTVHDLISFEANIKGGVHAGTPKEEKEKALEQFAEFLRYKDLRITAGQLKAIGRVVVKALYPLRQAIQENA